MTDEEKGENLFYNQNTNLFTKPIDIDLFIGNLREECTKKGIKVFGSVEEAIKYLENH